MKILRLRSRNINSLKGDNEIDFETFLGGNALFAITGETGAGKTTLLDVITCALYGRTARLSKGSEVQELMSRGTGEAMCEVEFEVKGKHYRSTWTLRRARGKADGKFQSAKMELVALPKEKIIEAKASSVPKKIEEVTGLDFDRFTQSMMLAQGGFDAFLKTDEKERSKLLEKITGTRIYSEISKQVYERAKEGREAITLIETRLEAIGTLPEDGRKQLEEELAQHIKEEEKQKEVRQKSQDAFRIKEQTVTLQQELEAHIKAEQDARQELERKGEDFKKLELSNRALSVIAVYERKKELERTLKEQKEALKNLEVEIETLVQKKHSLERKKVQTEEAYTKGKDEYETQSEKIEQTKEKELLIQKYEEDRKRLEAGEACYLCGSTEHPYIDHGNTPAFSSDTDEKIASLKNELSTEDENLNRLTVALTAAQTQAQNTRLECQKIEAEIAAHNVFFAERNTTVTEESEADIKEQIETVNAQLTRLAKLRKERETLRLEKERSAQSLAEQQKQIDSLQNNLLRLENDLKRDRETLEKHRQSLIDTKAKLDQYWNTYALISDSRTLEERYEHLDERKTAFKANEKALDEAYKLHNEVKLELGSKTSTLESEERTLDTMESELKGLQTREVSVEQEGKSILDTENIEAYVVAVEQKWQKIQKAFNDISNDYRVATDTLSDKEKSLKTLNETLTHKQQEVDETIKLLDVKMKENGFENEETLTSALLPETERNALQAEYTQIQEKLTQAATRKKDAVAKLAALKEKTTEEIEQKTLKTLKEEKEVQEALYDTLREKLGTLKNKIETDRLNREKHRETLDELSRQRAVQDVWEKLNELIGAQDGAKFAKFAQGITLDNLIYLANRHLAFLTDRYTIVRLKGDGQQLEIAVIDKFQGDEVRPSNTLSGGESFLVSLSLALGLSELASQKISIDSLFLDEGFGTLDSDTLDIALNALNMLESRGKMVGVISHVETMKERIPLQIRIYKNGGGESRMELIGWKAQA